MVVDYSQPPKMVHFNGVHPLQWVQQVERFYFICSISDSLKLPLASLYIDGYAREWFYSRYCNNYFRDWDHFVDELFDHFRNWTPPTSTIPDMSAPTTVDNICNRDKCEITDDKVFDENPQRDSFVVQCQIATADSLMDPALAISDLVEGNYSTNNSKVTSEISEIPMDKVFDNGNLSSVDKLEGRTEEFNIPIGTSLVSIPFAPLVVSNGCFGTVDISLETRNADEKHSQNNAPNLFDKYPLWGKPSLLSTSSHFPPYKSNDLPSMRILLFTISANGHCVLDGSAKAPDLSIVTFSSTCRVLPLYVTAECILFHFPFDPGANQLFVACSPHHSTQSLDPSFIKASSLSSHDNAYSTMTSIPSGTGLPFADLLGATFENLGKHNVLLVAYFWWLCYDLGLHTRNWVDTGQPIILIGKGFMEPVGFDFTFSTSVASVHHLKNFVAKLTVSEWSVVDEYLPFCSYYNPDDRELFTSIFRLHNTFGIPICHWVDTCQGLHLVLPSLAWFELISVDISLYITASWLDNERGVFDERISRNLLMVLDKNSKHKNVFLQFPFDPDESVPPPVFSERNLHLDKFQGLPIALHFSLFSLGDSMQGGTLSGDLYIRTSYNDRVAIIILQPKYLTMSLINELSRGYYCDRLFNHLHSLFELMQTRTCYVAIAMHAGFLDRLMVFIHTDSAISAIIIDQAGASHVSTIYASEMVDCVRKHLAGRLLLNESIMLHLSTLEDGVREIGILSFCPRTYDNTEFFRHFTAFIVEALYLVSTFFQQTHDIVWKEIAALPQQSNSEEVIYIYDDFIFFHEEHKNSLSYEKFNLVPDFKDKREVRHGPCAEDFDGNQVFKVSSGADVLQRGAFDIKDVCKLVKLNGDDRSHDVDTYYSATIKTIELASEKVQKMFVFAEEVNDSDKVQFANFSRYGIYAVIDGLTGFGFLLLPVDMLPSYTVICKDERFCNANVFMDSLFDVSTVMTQVTLLLQEYIVAAISHGTNLEDKVLIEAGSNVMNGNSSFNDTGLELATFVWDPG